MSKKISGLQPQLLCASVAGAMALALLVSVALASDPVISSAHIEPLAQVGQEAADATVAGSVMDAEGPVAGVTVRLQATEYSTLTDEDGTFTLAVPSGSEPITVTAWGPGYYNGWAVVAPGERRAAIVLKPHYATDNYEYEWFELDGLKGSAACGSCHYSYEEWQADAHGQSAINPRFQSLYAGTDVHGNKSPFSAKTNLGIPIAPDLSQPYFGPGYALDFPNRAGNCATCHTPVAAKIPNNTNCGWSGCHASSTSSAASSNLDPGVSPMQLTGVAAEGISCEFCHKIGDVYIKKETGLPYEDSPGILSVRLYRPSEGGEDLLFGPLDDVLGADPTHVKDSALPLMTESEFCAGCHFGVMGGVVGNMEVTGGVLVYNSYGEWLESPYSDEESGKSCQDCHMPTLGSGYLVDPAKGGIFRDGSQIHSHTMSGGTNEEFLQSAVSLTATATLQDEWLWVNVKLFNEGAGHHVPTDSPLRQMLLVVEVKDQDGKPIALAYGSKLPEWAGDLGGLPGKAFAKILQDEWTGEIPSVAIWRPIRVVEDTRLPARKSDHSMYTFAISESESNKSAIAEGESYTVEVRLIYRRAFQQLAQWKGWSDPDILMAEQSIAVQSGD